MVSDISDKGGVTMLTFRPRSDRLRTGNGRTQGLLRNAPLLKVYNAVNSWLPMLDLVCAVGYKHNL